MHRRNSGKFDSRGPRGNYNNSGGRGNRGGSWGFEDQRGGRNRRSGSRLLGNNEVQQYDRNNRRQSKASGQEDFSGPLPLEEIKRRRKQASEGIESPQSATEHENGGPRQIEEPPKKGPKDSVEKDEPLPAENNAEAMHLPSDTESDGDHPPRRSRRIASLKSKSSSSTLQNSVTTGDKNDRTVATKRDGAEDRQTVKKEVEPRSIGARSKDGDEMQSASVQSHTAQQPPGIIVNEVEHESRAWSGDNRQPGRQMENSRPDLDQDASGPPLRSYVDHNAQNNVYEPSALNDHNGGSDMTRQYVEDDTSAISPKKRLANSKEHPIGDALVSSISKSRRYNEDGGPDLQEHISYADSQIRAVTESKVQDTEDKRNRRSLPSAALAEDNIVSELTASSLQPATKIDLTTDVLSREDDPNLGFYEDRRGDGSYADGDHVGPHENPDTNNVMLKRMRVASPRRDISANIAGGDVADTMSNAVAASAVEFASSAAEPAEDTVVTVANVITDASFARQRSHPTPAAEMHPERARAIAEANEAHQTHNKPERENNVDRNHSRFDERKLHSKSFDGRGAARTDIKETRGGFRERRRYDSYKPVDRGDSSRIGGRHPVNESGSMVMASGERQQERRSPLERRLVLVSEQRVDRAIISPGERGPSAQVASLSPPNSSSSKPQPQYDTRSFNDSATLARTWSLVDNTRTGNIDNEGRERIQSQAWVKRERSGDAHSPAVMPTLSPPPSFGGMIGSRWQHGHTQDIEFHGRRKREEPDTEQLPSRTSKRRRELTGERWHFAITESSASDPASNYVRLLTHILEQDGELDRALNVLEEMLDKGMQPDLGVCQQLLREAVRRRDMEILGQTFKQLSQAVANQLTSTDYLLVCQGYAFVGDATRLRMVIDQAKRAGVSLTTEDYTSLWRALPTLKNPDVMRALVDGVLQGEGAIERGIADEILHEMVQASLSAESYNAFKSLVQEKNVPLDRRSLEGLVEHFMKVKEYEWAFDIFEYMFDKGISFDEKTVFSLLMESSKRSRLSSLAVKVYDAIRANIRYGVRDIPMLEKVIVAFTQHGCTAHAVVVLDDMVSLKITPQSADIYHLLLRACTEQRMLDRFVNAIKKVLEPVDALIFLNFPHAVLEDIIRACVQSGLTKDAFFFYRYMRNNGVPRSPSTVESLLSALAENVSSLAVDGSMLVLDAQKSGYPIHDEMLTVMIHSLRAQHLWRDGEKFLDALRSMQRHSPASAMSDAFDIYLMVKRYEETAELYKGFRSGVGFLARLDPEHVKSLIGGTCDVGRVEVARQMVQDMRREGVSISREICHGMVQAITSVETEERASLAIQVFCWGVESGVANTINERELKAGYLHAEDSWSFYETKLCILQNLEFLRQTSEFRREDEYRWMGLKIKCPRYVTKGPRRIPTDTEVAEEVAKWCGQSLHPPLRVIRADESDKRGHTFVEIAKRDIQRWLQDVFGSGPATTILDCLPEILDKTIENGSLLRSMKRILPTTTRNNLPGGAYAQNDDGSRQQADVGRLSVNGDDVKKDLHGRLHGSLEKRLEGRRSESRHSMDSARFEQPTPNDASQRSSHEEETRTNRRDPTEPSSRTQEETGRDRASTNWEVRRRDDRLLQNPADRDGARHLDNRGFRKNNNDMKFSPYRRKGRRDRRR